MYINRHFLKESIRQTRGMGIFFIAAALVSSCFYPVLQLIDHFKNKDSSYDLVSVSQIGEALPYVCVIFAILFIIKLFDFLFKRGSSDFYHALPFKRQTIFFTNLLAAFIWYAAGLVISVGAVMLIYAFDPVIVVKPSFFFISLAVYMILMLLVSGAMLVSTSITGKKSLAAMVGMMIIFLPRGIFFLAIETVAEKTSLIMSSAIKFFSPKYSLAFSLLIGEGRGAKDQAFAFMPGIINSLVMAVLLILAGAWLFTIRKSETAENAVPNRILDAVLQISYSIIFFFLAVTIYYDRKDGYGDEDIFIALFFVFVGLVVFALYELIYTKSFKKLLKSLPRLGIIVALSIVYYIVISVSSNVLLNKKINPEEIKYIKAFDEWDAVYGGYNVNSYASLLRRDIRFDDSEIKSLIAKGYENQAENGDGFLERWRNLSSPYLIAYTDGSENVRLISLSEEDDLRLQELLEANSEWKEAGLKLPEKCYINSFREKKHNEQIWDCFYEEYNKLDDEKKRVVRDGRRNSGYDVDPGNSYDLNIQGYYGIMAYSDSMSIYSSIMPKTYDLYNELNHEENVDAFRKVEKYLKEGAPKNGGGSIEIMGSHYESGISISYEVDKKDIVYLTVGFDSFTEGYYSHTLSGSSAREFVDRLFDCIDYETIRSSSEDPYMDISYYSYSGLSNKDINGHMNVGIDTDKLNELVYSLINSATFDK